MLQSVKFQRTKVAVEVGRRDWKARSWANRLAAARELPIHPAHEGAIPGSRGLVDCGDFTGSTGGCHNGGRTLTISKELRMRPTPLITHRRPGWRLAFAAILGLMFGMSACHRYEVRTVAAPDANFAGRRTFRILAVPAYTGTTALANTDPMLVNSITYQAIRDAIRQEFEARGYRYSPDRADLDVAYYATAQPRMDIRTFNYGYDWRGFPLAQTEVVTYEEGTVIIDVIDPVTRRLMWRGQARAAVSTNPDDYIREIRKAVHEIVEKFPQA
jgi:hypothetical protein